MMTGTYEIIYADPPWRYSAKKVQGAAENHYPTMSIDELCALPVAELAAKDSALFMWATFPQLPEALRLIRAWGFTYKSVAFVWLKKNKKADSWFYGLGFWTRANAEVCLLATKGHPKRQAADIHQFIISPIEAHSKKPDATRDKIVALMGDRSRVELFARQTPPGWDVWGNEVEPTAGLWSRWPEDSGKEDVSSVCCIAWCIFLLKMAHYFFAVVTNAPITYYGTVCIVLFGLMWSIVMELKQELKEYLLGFPQEYWLVPCSNSSRYNKVFRFIWLVGVVLGMIFLLMIK